MFKRSFPPKKDRVNKIKKQSRRSFNDDAKLKLREQLNSPRSPPTAGSSPLMNSEFVTLSVGRDQTIFMLHENHLSASPYLAAKCVKRWDRNSEIAHIALPDEDPETFSAIAEYLYYGDYRPHLVHDTRRDTWVLEDAITPVSTPKTTGSHWSIASSTTTLHNNNTEGGIMRDTAIYCSAGRYELPDLQRLALRKQCLRTGVTIPTMLRSARFAYEKTPQDETKLRAHFLTLLIRSRNHFKRSRTMQDEMIAGGEMFFDLFVAMCEHIDHLDSQVRSLSTEPSRPVY